MRVFMSKMILQLMALLGLSEMVFSEESDQFPPVPSWQPAFSAPVELQLERMVFYTDDTRDLVQYKNGTVVVINKGLDDNEAKLFANEVLSKIYNYHPDMNPLNMKDGNILVRYNHPAFNVVLTEFTSKYIDTIRNKYRYGRYGTKFRSSGVLSKIGKARPILIPDHANCSQAPRGACN